MFCLKSICLSNTMLYNSIGYVLKKYPQYKIIMSIIIKMIIHLCSVITLAMSGLDRKHDILNNI